MAADRIPLIRRKQQRKMWHRSVRLHFPLFTFDFRFPVCYTVDSKRNAGTIKQKITGGRTWKRHIYFWQMDLRRSRG